MQNKNESKIIKKRDFVGVIPPITFRDSAYPKQLMLMFDRLAVDLSNNLSAHEYKVINSNRNEINYLSEQGLLTTLSGIIADNKHGLDSQNVSVTGAFLLPGELANYINRFASNTVTHYNGLLDLRKIASKLRSLEGIDAVAVGLPDIPLDLDGNANRDEVIKISLSQFPMPTDTTAWADILDFKNEIGSKEMFDRLKIWINTISKKGLKNYEVEDELRGMISSYTNQMNCSKIKSQSGIVEAIITVPLEFAQNILRLKFGDAAKMFFNVKKQHLTLLEEERKADGNEIAYIIRTQKQFSV